MNYQRFLKNNLIKNHLNITEAKSSIEAAKKLIDRIKGLIKEENPQRNLF